MGSQSEPPAVNGTASYSHTVVDKLIKEEYAEYAAVSKLSPIHDEVLKTFRVLIADLCEQFGGGHPGGAIGMAAIGVALWKYVMRYAPNSPDWFNRDRFVLSNGHTCLFQYTFLHLSGYKEMTLEKLKGYHSDDPETICPGHPEIENEGIEVTTGPLGQGIANAVGMAAGVRHLETIYNRPKTESGKSDLNVVDCHIWCMVGDACLQEGVGQEALSIAGHWKLGNLTVIYDNNQITCDGSVDLTNTEDINSKVRAMGWEVIDVWDGCFGIEAIVDALRLSKRTHDQPTFINIRTIIGVGSAVAGNAVAHGAAFKVEDVAEMKRQYGFDPKKSFALSDNFYNFFSDLPSRGDKHVAAWKNLFEEYRVAHPDLAASLETRIRGELPKDWESAVPKDFGEKPVALRKAAGLVLDPLAAKCPSFMVGTADLTPSVHMAFEGSQPFNHPDIQPISGPRGSYAGRYIHYGIREHAMCAIANGLAAFNPGTFLPVTSSFLMFYLYGAPAVRMGALQNLPVIHAATHDSIGMGEDGPTHQPLELSALFRAMPTLLFFRPGDAEEVAGAWMIAARQKKAPSLISNSRHAVRIFKGKSDRTKVEWGGYVLEDVADADVTLIGSGAELEIAAAAADVLREKYSKKVRLVSVPCMRLLDQQPRSYKRELLRRHDVGGKPGIPAVVVEGYVGLGWERYADAGCVMGTHRYGVSAPSKFVYKYFGFTGDSIAERVDRYLTGLAKGPDAEDGYVRGEWAEL